MLVLGRDQSPGRRTIAACVRCELVSFGDVPRNADHLVESDADEVHAVSGVEGHARSTDHESVSATCSVRFESAIGCSCSGAHAPTLRAVSLVAGLLSVMRESIEFKIPEEHASRWLENHDGVSLGGSVRKLEPEKGDPRMQIVEKADRELKGRGRSFFTAWRQRRTYTKAELEAAVRFRLRVAAVFEPAGEVCGTKYDEMAACELCGSGAKQVGPLILDVRRIPRESPLRRPRRGRSLSRST